MLYIIDYILEDFVISKRSSKYKGKCMVNHSKVASKSGGSKERLYEGS